MLRRRSLSLQRETRADNAYAKAELLGDGRPRLKKDDTAEIQKIDAVFRPLEAGVFNGVAEPETDWTGWEAPALLEGELSKDASETECFAANQPQQRSLMTRNSIQQTPVAFIRVSQY